MNISYKSLKKLIDFDETPQELDRLLTDTGLEVEAVKEIQAVPGGLKGLVVGEVLTCKQHPNADKLKVTTVDIGEPEPVQIVCGAPNVAQGQKVIVATVGATLYPTPDESFTIKKSKIRGELSQGMICAEDEIGMGKSHDGIMVLTTSLPNGAPASEYFNLESDYLIEIGLTPNRADGASHYGVARDIRAMNGKDIKLEDLSHIDVGSAKATIDLEVEDTEACPRFNGLEIRGIEVKESPAWLKEFLITIGLKPINAVVDISNYVCHFLGQPMHIFDADKIRGNKIIVKRPKAGTKITTLDEVERTLTGKELAICDTQGPIALAGVFGGFESGVTEETRNIFLEVAYFNADVIRFAATHHSLSTDASFRYERGTDPNMPPYAIRFAAKLIQELVGGERCDAIYDNYPQVIKPKTFTVSTQRIKSLMGTQISDEKIVAILERLDIECHNLDTNLIEVTVPPYRVDVTREADIVEEVLRIFGFKEINESDFMSASFLSQFPVVNHETEQTRISELLASSGYYEIQSMSIVNPAQNQLVDENDATTVKLLNPLSEEHSEMRKSLLFSGLETLAFNINRKQKDVALYEFGRIYTYNKEKDKYTDRQVLGIWLTGSKEPETWYEKSKEVTLYDLKKVVGKVLESLRVNVSSSEALTTEHLSYGMGFKVNNNAAVVLGKVKPSLCKKSGVKQEVFYAEIDWAMLLKKYKPEVQFEEISKYPPVRRDLSLVIDKKVTYTQIENIALKTEKKLLKSINVFDVYEGDKIEEGKKAYALSFILQDEAKTLNDKVIDKTMSKLIHNFENQLGAIIRK